MKRLTPNGQSLSRKISPGEWYNYTEQSADDFGFREEAEQTLDNHDRSTCDSCHSSHLDEEITKEEIVAALKSLKRGKAPGPDGLASDFFVNEISLFSFPLVLGLLFYPWLPTSSKTGRGGG